MVATGQRQWQTFQQVRDVAHLSNGFTIVNVATRCAHNASVQDRSYVERVHLGLFHRIARAASLFECVPYDYQLKAIRSSGKIYGTFLVSVLIFTVEKGLCYDSIFPLMFIAMRLATETHF